MQSKVQKRTLCVVLTDDVSGVPRACFFPNTLFTSLDGFDCGSFEGEEGSGTLPDPAMVVEDDPEKTDFKIGFGLTFEVATGMRGDRPAFRPEAGLGVVGIGGIGGDLGVTAGRRNELLRGREGEGDDAWMKLSRFVGESLWGGRLLGESGSPVVFDVFVILSIVSRSDGSSCASTIGRSPS